MKRYQNQIESLQNERERMMSEIVECEDRIDVIDKKVENLKALQDRLPERHQFPWDEVEKNTLKNALENFVTGTAKSHKRTKVAIAARIIKEKWLLDISNREPE